MDAKRVLAIQSERGAKSIGTESMKKSIEFVIAECRRFIQDKSDTYRELQPEQKRGAIKELIVTYVMNNPHIVEGYVDEENRPDTNKLMDKLVEDITDYGILTAAMLDPDVYEIRGNGKEIKVEIKGRTQDLKDKDGNIISFESVEQQDIIMRKLLGDVRITPKNALPNARTIEGYRIAGVHSSAMSPDPNDPTGESYHGFVLRKFKKSKMDLSDIVRFGTMSDGMARFMKLTTTGGLTTIFAGPTASGKTTLLNAALHYVPPTSRVVLAQNPSEVDARLRDLSGRVYNDVLHLEATEKENPTTSDPTMENVMAHILRLSPVYACMGEIRTNREFALGMMIMGAGHPLYASLHAENSIGAVNRFLRGYMAGSNESIDTALPGLTDLLNVIVIQRILKDGTRKIIQISEVLGADMHEKKPIVNDLYLFIPDKKPIYDANGNIVSIPGVHKRVGNISERTIRKLSLEGIKESMFDFLLEKPSNNEVELYTGENIEKYGM